MAKITADELLEKIKRVATHIYSIEDLEEKIKSGKKLRIKFGADPSRPDLHLGHTVPLRVLKAFQDAGHEVVFLIGDFTAMIGDPSGRSKTRPSLSFEETRKNSETYINQVVKILDVDKIKVMYNSEWLSKMSFEDVLKLGAKYTVARLLERDDFAKRLAEQKPIGVHEMFYPLMQGYDSVALNCDIEIGGTDQTFNVLVGRELQRDYNQTPQTVITFPLLVGLDGVEKMSKSLGNYIGITEDAETMFEKAMKIQDGALETYFELTTDYDLDKAKDLIKNDIVEAHVEYAKTIVEMYHSKEDAIRAYERYMQVANGGVPTNVEEVKIGKDKATLIECIMASGLCKSTSEARRLIQGNGVKVNGAVCSNFNEELDLSQETIIQKGKNKFFKAIK